MRAPTCVRVMKAGVAERKFLGDALLKLVAAVDAKRYFEMLRHVSNGQLYINMYHPFSRIQTLTTSVGTSVRVAAEARARKVPDFLKYCPSK